MLERLAETMFVDTARRYLDGLPRDATGWLAGLHDRDAGCALALMHESPERAWTIDELGRRVGLSRSALHERFWQFLGEPPMHDLANWRIQVGSRLLRETSRNVASIAMDVGCHRRAIGKAAHPDLNHAAQVGGEVDVHLPTRVLASAVAR